MLLNFQAFMDESYSNEEFVLGGHIATVEAWAQFSKRWEELLPFGTKAKNGKMHFKMAEMNWLGRLDRVQQFYKLIEDHVVSSISCRINLSDFRRAQERVRYMASRMNWIVEFAEWSNPYFFTWRALLDSFYVEREKLAAKLPLDRKVDFYFDDKAEKAIILAAWDQHLENKDEEVRARYGATPRFEDDQDFLPLQAADLWAWWVRQWYEDDSIEAPDKLLNFDFGNWRGKKRPIIVIAPNEDEIVDVLQSVVVGSAAQGNFFTLLPPIEP